MLPNPIGFDYVLNMVNEIITENKIENMTEIRKEIEEKNVKKSGPEEINHSQSRPMDYNLVDFRYNKMVALEFLRFCIENREKLNFDLSLFEKEEDRKLILKHIRNAVYLSLSSHNPKIENYIEIKQKYDKFNSNIQKIGEDFVLKAENNEYILPINHFEKVVFFHKYGTNELPSYIKENLAYKDFIDAGAFIGDTALILNQLKPNRIYAFEPSRYNYLLMQKTLKLNKLSNVTPVNSALGIKKSTSNLFYWENASFLSDKGNEKVNVTTIDSFQEENSLNIGLIKMDIEGSELDAIKGAERTIKKFKPVLIASVYHRGEDFFEIPKILKELVPTYNLRFLNLNQVAPILERVILAY